jgi:hypothetical protein
MARASHHTGGDVTKTFHLDSARVKFSRSITDSNGDGSVDFSDVQPTDVVVLKVFRGNWSAAHKSCHTGGGTSSGTNNSGIQKAFVFRPDEKQT